MAAAPARGYAALLAVAACAAAASLACCQVIKVTANNCNDISDAFVQLSRAYNTTTRPSPITLQLNLACRGGYD